MKGSMVSVIRPVKLLTAGSMTVYGYRSFQCCREGTSLANHSFHGEHWCYFVQDFRDLTRLPNEAGLTWLPRMPGPRKLVAYLAFES